MSDLISRQAVINAIADTILNGESLGYVLAEEIASETPSVDIMECARAIKEYCKSKPDNVFLACFKCPFFDGLEKNEETVCKLFGKPPHEWDLPEGEEKSCNTCKNSDDEFSGECYECVKGIFDRYESEGEKEPPVFIDSAPLKDCKNTAESYGEICVKCNKCGRFGREKE